jgi:hypothetical protein
MYHICKQDWMGCAIATVAAIADLSYEEVVTVCDGVSPAELRESEEIRRLLEKVTRTRWVGNCPRRPKAVSEMLFPDHPVAAFLQNRRESPQLGQWVAVRKELIHDPGLPAAYHLRRYLRRDWIVAQMFEPGDPSELDRRKNSRSRLVLQELAEQISISFEHVGNDYGPAA